MAPKGLQQLPEELLLEIVRSVVNPAPSRTFSKTKHAQEFVRAKCLSLVSRRFRSLVEPLAYRKLVFTDESTHDSLGRSEYAYHLAEALKTRTVPVPQFNFLATNQAVAQYIRHFRCRWVNMPHGGGIIATLNAAPFRAYVREIYSPGFSRFLEDLLAGITRLPGVGLLRGPGPAGAFHFQRRPRDIGLDLLAIFALTLAHSVEAVTLSIAEDHDKTPPDRFFAFCSAQRRVASAALESCLVSACLERPLAGAPTEGDAGDDDYHGAIRHPTLKHLEFTESEMSRRGGCEIVAHLLNTYPRLETLVLKVQPYGPYVGLDDQPGDHQIGTSYHGFARALRAHGRRLRRFDLDLYEMSPGEWEPEDYEVDDDGSLGGLRGHLTELEEPDLGDFLPPSLRYLWLRLSVDTLGSHRAALLADASVLATTLRSSAEKLPRLEYVLAEMATEDTHSPCAVAEVPAGWTEEKIEDQYYLFRRDGQATLATGGAREPNRNNSNVLSKAEHSEGWEHVLHEIISG
ncbi:uncharacterized protein B0I36DRAFT_362425 [Microdochium trichocladiopsis]|uniref:F-box domain-containing protein n=1 Tax=Microdochium trichocladiopsis TaxID=1682393 RepID=A0A9P9BTL6_9PEZI|nr:uncharacterized protein B0I36DRAFT_362425 [Microdochium trichocladiopsis]KAH7030589.1 hypothetical protein B0I36DRAFT_362425 [Microdochium trichocladiopsis]